MKKEFYKLNSLFILGFFILNYSQVAHAEITAERTCGPLFLKGPVNSNSKLRDIYNLETFGLAMTEGMLLHPEQSDLFEIYRKVYFGDPNVKINNDLKSVTSELEKHPELEKPHFREYEIASMTKIYEVPAALAKFVQSQIQTAGQIRSNLFQIEANLGYWKKLLDYKESSNKDSVVKDSENSILDFKLYLNQLISESNQTLLADLQNESQDYKKKTLALFKTLQAIEASMEQKDQNTLPVRKAMVDLVHNVGFGNPSTLALLKSKNGLEKIEGLTKILDERDAVAMELGFAGHFEELQKNLGVEFPTGFTKNDHLLQRIHSLEQEVLHSPSRTESSDMLRVRSLSIQEAPFRSCIGGSDCSSRTYFHKALDPNFNYFTMTDPKNHSSGHVTVVLGQATDRDNGHVKKVAFIDKIQNVPNRQLPLFLKAVALTLQEKGFLLGLPIELGNHNGITNLAITHRYLEDDVLPKLNKVFEKFKPIPNKYEFKNTYSRAYDFLSLKIVDINLNDFDYKAGDFSITPGQEYQKFMAPQNLNKEKFVEEFLNLKNSHDPKDLLKFITSSSFVTQLEEYGIYSSASFNNELLTIIKKSELPFNIRKTAFFEKLLLSVSKGVNLSLLSRFSESEIKQLGSEIVQWKNSNDERKRKLFFKLEQFKKSYLDLGDLSVIDQLTQLGIIDIHQKDESGNSFLSKVIYYNHVEIAKWLLQKNTLNLNSKNHLGLTDLEIAYRLNRKDIIKAIEMHMPDLQNKTSLQVPERLSENKSKIYPEGKPFIGFVKVPGGTFNMKDDQNHTYKVTISQPFHLMSVETTQKMWKEVLDLYAAIKMTQQERVKLHLKTLIPQKFQSAVNPENANLQLSPSSFKGDFNPVESVSYIDVSEWLKNLNDLSNLDDETIQKKLAEIFPDHQLGDVYGLPSEAQLAFVGQLGGLAEGNFSHGNSFNDLGDYAWYFKNSDKTTHPVGLKKPITYFGKPIYDLHGHVFEWTKDWWHKLKEGVDPIGDGSGTTARNSYRSVPGSSFKRSREFLVNGSRAGEYDHVRSDAIGFRLVREKKI
jgi:formylglycine-generating enzyme required for sulfatase activity